MQQTEHDNESDTREKKRNAFEGINATSDL